MNSLAPSIMSLLIVCLCCICCIFCKDSCGNCCGLGNIFNFGDWGGLDKIFSGIKSPF